MKNIYDDNQILSPLAMEQIAKEFYSQKIETKKQIPDSVANLLKQNLTILEYINSYQKNTTANLQKCLIKTYSIIKATNQTNTNNTTLSTALDYSKNFNTVSIKSAKQTCLNNSLEIIQTIANNYKHILLESEHKAINVCIESINELLK